MNVALSKALVLLSALTAAAIPGWAVLGGSVESVVTDQVNLQAKRTVIETREYTVHQMSRDDGTLIREYVTPAGKVFGVCKCAVASSIEVAACGPKNKNSN